MNENEQYPQSTNLSNFQDGVIKVSAAWCGPCKLMSPVVEEVKADEAFKNLSFVNLDAELDADTVGKLNIKSVPTFLFYKDGVEAHRKSGLISKSSLTGLINEFVM